MTPRRRRLVLAVCVLLVLGAWSRWERRRGAGRSWEQPTARLVQRAEELRREVRAVAPGHAPQALDAALDAARALRDEPAAAAEALAATFRAGELARAAGREHAARVAFEWVAERSAATPFHGRARLELAHLARRRGDARAALHGYSLLSHSAEVPSHVRDTALDWVARTHAACGRTRAARDVWKVAAACAKDPLARLRAHLALARSHRDDGDLSASKAALDTARVELATLFDEPGERGARARELWCAAHARACSSDAQREFTRDTRAKFFSFPW